MVKKISLPVAITIFCVVIFLGLTVAFLNRKQVEIKPKETIKRTDYTQVARRTLDWIDKQRNDQGGYILERGCDHETKTCDIVWDNQEGNKDGLIATWVRLNFFEQHGDPKDLEIVKRDIDRFYDKYKDDNLKDSLWICKTTYEMAQSKHLDQAQKDKLKELCMRVDYPEVEGVKKYFDDKNVLVNKLKDETQISWEEYSLAIRGFDNYLSLATEILIRDKWQENRENLDMAKDYWLVAKDYLDKVEPENKCLIGLTGLDIYRLGNKDEEVLDLVKGIYDKYIKETEEGNKKRRSYQTVMCGMMVKGLYEITGEVEYGRDLEFNNEILTKFNLDESKNMNRMVDDDGFYKSIWGSLLAPFKNVAENGLIVELLRN